MGAIEDPTHAAIGAAPVLPTSGSERFVSMDMLRGVAVLGILAMNIYAFAMPFAGYMNPLAIGGTEWYNLGTWMVTHIFFDQKFISIFSMLFGAGIVLICDRAEARGARPTGLFYRRQFWLLIIGVAHGYLLWIGDILFVYAIIGMLFYRMRRWQPRSLFILAACLLPVAVAMSYANGAYTAFLMDEVAGIEQAQEAGEALSPEQQEMLDGWGEMRPFMAPTEQDLADEIEAYQQGYIDVVKYRAPETFAVQTFSVLMFGIWRVGALMLIGMAMMKLGVFTGQLSHSGYRRLMLMGYGVGLPIMLFSAWDLYQHAWDSVYFFKVGNIANYVGSLFVALGHVSLVMLIAKSGALASIMRRFAAVGRMALTNYLTHSLVLTTVFYGYGLGLFGQVPRIWQMLFVAAVISLQLIVSPWWLQRFRFGPVEWLWRSLTYWQRQPMRRAAAGAGAPGA